MYMMDRYVLVLDHSRGLSAMLPPSVQSFWLYGLATTSGWSWISLGHVQVSPHVMSPSDITSLGLWQVAPRP